MGLRVQLHILSVFPSVPLLSAPSVTCLGSLSLSLSLSPRVMTVPGMQGSRGVLTRILSAGPYGGLADQSGQELVACHRGGKLGLWEVE